MANSVDISRELLQLVQPRTFDAAPVPGLLTGSQPGTAPGDSVSELAREVGGLSRQLGAGQEAARLQAETIDRNTRAILAVGARPEGDGLSGSVRGAADTVRRSTGLGALASPLSGLAGWLFGRRGQSEPAPELPDFRLPPAVEAGLALPVDGDRGLEPVSYAGDGLPRRVAPAQSGTPSQVTIQVQAMDSRSFLDNSDQIARAVREAMLNSHSINDVIGDM